MAMRILDAGQCGFDGPRMAALLRNRLDATMDRAATARDAERLLSRGRYNVILVNRVFAADGASGLDFIGRQADAGSSTPIMLVRDHPDALDLAVAKGAVRGFGNAELEAPETLDVIRAAAERNGQP